MKEQVVQYRDDLPRCFLSANLYCDGEVVDLISLGAVRSEGDEFYAVNSEAKLHVVSDWTRKNVLSFLPAYGDAAWRTRRQIAESFAQFVSSSARYAQGPNGWTEEKKHSVHEAWARSPGEWVAICRLYGSGTAGGLPSLFPRYMDLSQLAWLVGNPRIERQRRGNALEDAKTNKVTYDFLRSVPSGVWGYGEED